ncbi:hypothetical protein SCX53_00390 [Legionella pneumophila serogroup 1]
MIKKITRKYYFIAYISYFRTIQKGTCPLSIFKNIGSKRYNTFSLDSAQYLAIPQLSKDEPGIPANINGGNAKVDVLIFKWINGKFHLYQKIPGHGNEGIE